jgi:primase-polymerase (primpol)-like protein
MSAANGDKFRDLWEGQWEPYSYESQSEADLALCRMLAYWTDGNEQQMDRLFRRSCLMRPKWDEWRGAETYGERTLRVAKCKCRRITYLVSSGISMATRREPGLTIGDIGNNNRPTVFVGHLR